jgi:signal recognition particle subunit SRP54
MRDALDNFDEREVDRTEAIIRSMTPAERANPKILNGSRRARIAAGSGTRVADINDLMTRFDSAQTMMRQMVRGGGMPGMPSMGRMPGSGKKTKGRTAPPPTHRGKKAKSGNPAKRAEQEQAARTRTQGSSAPAGSAFGLGASSDPDQPLQLPEGFDQFFKR